SLGIPFTTWSGEFFRGRMGHFMYTRMNMPEMISPTHEAYADMAIQLANDKAFRDEVSAKIRERSHVFYENHAAVDELAECLKRLYAA
ncbi:MAG: hypothetical protein K2Q01_00425, partial [Rickettsiales bacterium]|nr:hypothetical protein [Rickettsiales bacterium]